MLTNSDKNEIRKMLCELKDEIRGELWGRADDSFFDRQKIKADGSISFVTLAENGDIDEVTSAEHPEMFADWQPNISYKDSNIRRYGADLYKCLQDHTSQSEWTPDISVSLWKKIGDPTVEYPEWSQPVGASDAYQSGDKVSYNSKHWVSNTNNNVWQPGVYGWDEV